MEKQEYTLTIDAIFKTSLTLCDDTVPITTLVLYLNKGIDVINANVNLTLPAVNPKSVDDLSNVAAVYDVCTSPFANNKIAHILSNFVAKCIKDVDGYAQESNIFSQEFYSLLVSFNSKYRNTIKEEFLINPGNVGSVSLKKENVRRNRWLSRNTLF